MRLRALAIATAAAVLLPGPGTAQMMPLQDDPAQHPRVRISPWIGWLPAVTRTEEWVNSDGGGANTFVDIDYTLDDGYAAGFNVEVRVHGPWNVFGGAIFATRGDSEFAMRDSADAFEINGSRFLALRAGASYVLNQRDSELALRRLSGSVHVAPFYMHEMPRAEVGFDDSAVFQDADHFGLSIGATGELPFATDRLALQLGVDDFITFWNDDALARLPAAFFDDAGTGAVSRVESDVSHQWVVRAGISVRMR
jgi:hypothetical protein